MQNTPCFKDMDKDELLKKVFDLSKRAQRSERIRAQRRIRALSQGKGRLYGEKLESELLRLAARLERSAEVGGKRYGRFPFDAPDPPLPIAEKKKEIIEAIRANRVVIVSGATGSGKSTQLPKYCVLAGCGRDGRIGCTQPRRIAAISVARRIAEELGDAGGELVGYKIRFSDRTSEKSLIKVMTDGMLLAEAHADPFLNEYDAVIVDEAHERSLNIDFLLGILRRLLSRRRDLRVVITSATLDTEKFASSFEGAPVIEVTGRTYPVEVRYMPPGEMDGEALSCAEQAVSAVDALCRSDPFGDILVFMPTSRDINEACRMIEGRRYKGVVVMPLYARLSAADQARIFSRPAGRKIIVATNIAETSITVPGIRYVVDTGLARISYYSPRTGTTSLAVRPISKSSCLQRTGRCGRVENGVCIRLYDEKDFESRHLFTPPEILRANLAEVVLRMMALNLGDVEKFPFIDPPKPRSVRDGYDTLVELGAIEETAGKGKRFSLTRTGRIMARIPLDPRLSRILIEAGKNGCIRQAIVIVCALSMQDPREFPADREGEAREAHARFADGSSDFLTLLNIWEECEGLGSSRLKRFCAENFLSFRRVREWQDLCSQVAEIAEEHGLSGRAAETQDRKSDPEGFYASLHKAILSGYLSNIAEKKDDNTYVSAKSGDVTIFPGSALFDSGPALIVAAEFVETARLYARTVAAIERRWLKELGRHLCRDRYLHPRWSRRRGKVIADRRTTLFGIEVDYKEAVPYGPADPAVASDIFIRCALVNFDMEEEFPFLVHNRSLVEEARSMENRLRTRGLVATEEDMVRFYKARLGDGVFDVATLKNIVESKGDAFLMMERCDVVLSEPDSRELALFPDTIVLGGESFPCSYEFDPSSDRDGVTVRIPVHAAADIPPHDLDWLVPGMLEEKITALFKGLPKEYRRLVVPVAGTVRIVMEKMPRGGRPLATALSTFLAQRLGVEIPASAWRFDTLLPHLVMRIEVTDGEGKVLAASRDPGILRRYASASKAPAAPPAARQRWERSGCVSWEFPDLPDFLEEKSGGKVARFYPGLVDRGKSVDLRLFASRSAALDSHVEGIKRLLLLAIPHPKRRVDRFLALSGRAVHASVLFGGARALESRMAEKVENDLLRVNIRTRGDFESYVQKAPRLMGERASALRKACADVVTELYDTLSVIQELEAGAMAGGDTVKTLSHIRFCLGSIVPDSFVEIYDIGEMERIVRYIRAAAIRAKRAAENIEREKRKQERVRWAEDALSRLVDDLSDGASAEKREAVEKFFWMVEEYKVSVFAQELGTRHPVSEKKLAELLKTIEAMA